jgi:uncharacterized pyridoxamine 5'-phosphate oxidase family protein
MYHDIYFKLFSPINQHDIAFFPKTASVLTNILDSNEIYVIIVMAIYYKKRGKNIMNKITEFLRQCGIFYLATMDGEQPRVRPFGAVMEYEGKIYFCTNNTKPVYAQMLKNPMVEMSCSLENRWIRVSGRVMPDTRSEVKEAMLNEVPSLRNLYRVDDGIFEVFYLAEGTGTIYEFGKDAEEITL